MKNKFKHSINLIAIYIACVSFILGTLILLIHKTKLFGYLYDLGLFYVGAATITNLIILLFLIRNSIVNRIDYKENIIAICILLANIPITLFYINLI